MYIKNQLKKRTSAHQHGAILKIEFQRNKKKKVSVYKTYSYGCFLFTPRIHNPTSNNNNNRKHVFFPYTICGCFLFSFFCFSVLWCVIAWLLIWMCFIHVHIYFNIIFYHISHDFVSYNNIKICVAQKNNKQQILFTINLEWPSIVSNMVHLPDARVNII